MYFKHAFFLVFIAIFLTNCTKDKLPEKQDSLQDDPAVLAIQAEVDQAIAELLNDDEAPSNGISNRNHVYVPGGTGNRLADAVAEAGPFGTVVLGAGMHYEHNPLTISSTVTIKGEDGAVLKLTSGAPQAPDQAPYDMVPGLHVKDRAFVKIANLTIEPMGYAGEGGLAILFENAPNASVYNNNISGFQFGILLAKADRAKMHGNTFTGFNYTGDHVGVTVMDAESVKIYENEFSQYAVGLFASDRKGTAYENTFHNNTIGLLLCTVPADFVLNGELVGAPRPATKWTVNKNTAYDNGWGYLAIDGAFKNILHLNDAWNNSFYDIELAGDSNRFGFFTPTSEDNFVCSYGAFNDLIIKVCGVDNHAYGGQIVDTSADPCF